jgi:putative protein-disulfide isomerase
LDLKFRKLLFYPLNYGTIFKWVAKIGISLNYTKQKILPPNSAKLHYAINIQNMRLKTLSLLLVIISYSCLAQKTTKMEPKNPLLCNPKTGICELPATASTKPGKTVPARHKPVKLIYFTDPICSACWGIEPQLRKLKLEYGDDIEIEYHMGGLLPDWSYNAGGISKPSDVAHHWDEVSAYYKMPIDGDVWLEDPLPSSYPPSIAFKAAQMQDEQKAVVFLRILREYVFLRKKNIAKWEVMEQAAREAGLDIAKLKRAYEGDAKDKFQRDLELTRQLGVRGFPTIIMTGEKGKTEPYGMQPYTTYEAGIRKIYPAVHKSQYSKDWQHLFEKYPTLTTREFAELSDISFKEAEDKLQKLRSEGTLNTLSTKNGLLWIKK